MPGPGFVFVELYTQSIPEYIAFFQRTVGCRLIRDEGDFVELRLDAAIVLLNAANELPEGHPFRSRLPGHSQGVGVEIGIILADLTSAREAAITFPGWTVTEMQRQDWGLTDFRVTSPDGYYLRFTEAFA